MYKFLKENSWAIYLGGSLSAFGDLCYCNPDFWFIMVPVVMLVTWNKFNK